ncbi:winged helix DNA-binding domain-containing protein [Pseudonocardia bannensis]|uniref:Winged helix DNA-binding domain-containing protein n=1 Tax=Pseudonocardia bannensis TaxID=630973 RepID=A0A848DIH4_9PSEU|nr:winged helix DNA-binding domain-containing protein [Pseudonocardia bannensis]
MLWTDRTLVRTWAMRGTLHLLPVDELDLWTGALTDRESRPPVPAVVGARARRHRCGAARDHRRGGRC